MVDHADTVGHLFGLLDIMGGQNDCDAGSHATHRTTLPHVLASSTSTPAVGSSRKSTAAHATALWRSALGVSSARQGHDLAVLFSQRDTTPPAPFRTRCLLRGFPKSPRLKLTIRPDSSKASVCSSWGTNQPATSGAQVVGDDVVAHDSRRRAVGRHDDAGRPY